MSFSADQEMFLRPGARRRRRDLALALAAGHVPSTAITNDCVLWPPHAGSVVGRLDRFGDLGREPGRRVRPCDKRLVQTAGGLVVDEDPKRPSAAARGIRLGTREGGQDLRAASKFSARTLDDRRLRRGKDQLRLDHSPSIRRRNDRVASRGALRPTPERAGHGCDAFVTPRLVTARLGRPTVRRMDKTIACTACGAQIHSLLDQVLELRALVICQCRCGEIGIVLKPAPWPAGHLQNGMSSSASGTMSGSAAGR